LGSRPAKDSTSDSQFRGGTEADLLCAPPSFQRLSPSGDKFYLTLSSVCTFGSASKRPVERVMQAHTLAMTHRSEPEGRRYAHGGWTKPLQRASGVEGRHTALILRQLLLHLSRSGPGLPARQECPKPFLENHNSGRQIVFSKTAFFNQLNTIHTPDLSSEIFKTIGVILKWVIITVCGVVCPAPLIKDRSRVSNSQTDRGRSARSNSHLGTAEFTAGSPILILLLALIHGRS
jgi:hypothetical protein